MVLNAAFIIIQGRYSLSDLQLGMMAAYTCNVRWVRGRCDGIIMGDFSPCSSVHSQSLFLALPCPTLWLTFGGRSLSTGVFPSSALFGVCHSVRDWIMHECFSKAPHNLATFVLANWPIGWGLCETHKRWFAFMVLRRWECGRLNYVFVPIKTLAIKTTE